MIIDIDRIGADGIHIARDFDYLSADLVEESAVFLKPVHADLEVKKAGDELLIKGKITTVLNCVCSRCLKKFEFSVDSDFDLVFLPEELYEVKEELSEEDIHQAYFYGSSIDIREIILEQLNLTFPVKPLCSDSCEGMCPVCGAIRREGRCGCTAQETDDRTAKQKILIKR